MLRRKHDQKIPAIFQNLERVGHCISHQVCFLPAQPMHVALFLLSKIQAGHTFPTIDASFYAIKFFHKSVLNVDPCSHFFVTNMFEAAKRVTAHRIKKKKALSLDDLNKIFVKLNQNKTNLADQCLLTIMLITFCGFMRFSEVQDFVVQILFLVALTSRFSSRKVRQIFIVKECGFTSQLLVKFVH